MRTAQEAAAAAQTARRLQAASTANPNPNPNPSPYPNPNPYPNPYPNPNPNPNPNQAAAHGAMEAAAAAQVTAKGPPTLALLAQQKDQDKEDKEELARPTRFVLDEAPSSPVAEGCEDLACFLRAAKQSTSMEADSMGVTLTLT